MCNSETVSEYVVELRKLLEHCKFEAFSDNGSQFAAQILISSCELWNFDKVYSVKSARIAVGQIYYNSHYKKLHAAIKTSSNSYSSWSA